MWSREWRLACLGVITLTVASTPVRADETIRLGAKGSIKDAGANLSRLDLQPQNSAEDADDTVPVWFRNRYGFGGFYGGYRGFYGGYRGFYPGYSIGFSLYQPRYYGGFGYGGWGGYYGGGWGGYYGGGWGSYYGGFRNFNVAPAFYGGGFYGGGFCHINGSVAVTQVQPLTLQLKPSQPLAPVSPMNPMLGEPRPAVPANPNDGFRYDGGPSNPVPLPQGAPEPKAEPSPAVPDRAVSLPLKPSTPAPKKYQYAAYGEKPKTEVTPTRDDQTLFVKSVQK